MSRELSPELKAIGDELGVEIRAPYKKPTKVDDVRFKFSKEVWADLANAEGSLLGRCCANVSAIRDELMGAMREDGWMSAEDIQTIVFCMPGHDYADGHPVAAVKKAYDRLLPYLDLEGRSTRTCDLGNPRDVCSTVYFGKTWEFCAKYVSASIYTDWGNSVHDRAAQNRMIFQTVPIIKALHDKAIEAGFPPVEGYALLDKAGDIYETTRSLAIYGTREEADKVVGDWVKTKQAKKRDVRVAPVRVSMEKGVEVLDAPPAGFEPHAPPTQKQKDYAVDKIESLINGSKGEIEEILEEALRKIRQIRTDEEVGSI